MSLLYKIVEFGKMIKFSHSIFALPFALSGAILASREQPLSIDKIFWILVAMIGARSAAMGFNRLVDHKFDAANPRTTDRHLPSGKMSTREIRIFVIVFSVIFVFASSQLNMLCMMLSPVALFVILFYSFTKRFTSFSHYFLGIALGLSPIGAWLAITGYFTWLPIILGLAVVFWVAGFDILYSIQDVEFDIRAKLYSVPKLVGIKRALLVAKLSHGVSFILMAYLSWLVPFHFIYTVGLIIVGGLLTYEHSLVKADDLTKLDKAFFGMNGVISMIFFIAILGDLWLS
jgi:4-hydroxybenzoate polyprenyltransferase